MRITQTRGVNPACFADLDERTVIGKFGGQGDDGCIPGRFEHLRPTHLSEVDECITAQLINPIVEDTGEDVGIHFRAHFETLWPT
jgi:hypothetical protein